MQSAAGQLRQLVRRFSRLAAACLAAAGGVALLVRALGTPRPAAASASKAPVPAGLAALPVPARPAAGESPNRRLPSHTASPSAGVRAAQPRAAGQPAVDLGGLFAAIAAVESEDGRRPVGDGGRSLGPYHISRAYWKEATRHGGVRWDYATYVWSRRHCRQVMIWYWQRWCPEALQRGDLARLARIHNGGPRGLRKRATLRYWGRVRQALAAQARSRRPET